MFSSTNFIYSFIHSFISISFTARFKVRGAFSFLYSPSIFIRVYSLSLWQNIWQHVRTLNTLTLTHMHTHGVHSAAQNATTSLCYVYADNVILSENFIGSAYKMRYCIKRVPNLLGCLCLYQFRLPTYT